MTKAKYKITAQIVAHKTLTVSANSADEAVEKAAARLEKSGHELAGGVRWERIED